MSELLIASSINLRSVLFQRNFGGRGRRVTAPGPALLCRERSTLQAGHNTQKFMDFGPHPVVRKQVVYCAMPDSDIIFWKQIVTLLDETRFQ